MTDYSGEYIVKIRYKSQYKNVYIKRNDLTLESLINYAFVAFKIETQGEVKVELRDNMGILIPKDKVLQHIKAFWQNGAFFIDMTYSGVSDSQDIDFITPRMFEDYMKEINQRDLLTECKDKMEQNIASRQKIVQIAVDYMITRFGEDVNMMQRKMMANALLKLFPFMGFQNGHNIGPQTLINGTNRGWLNARYYHVRQIKRRQMNADLLSARAVDSSMQVADDNENHNVKDDVDLLKSLIVNTENLDLIKQLLNRTREYRAEMMLKNETEIKEHFPYFLSHPLELIPLEFEEKYKGTGVYSNGLIENWLSYREQLERALKDHRKEEFQTEWDLSVHNFFILIQLFPSKQVGRNVTASSANFEASIRKLVQFELLFTPPDQMAAASKSYPTIVACGKSEKEIEYFCLKLEGQTIPLPIDATFLDVFDLFFKTHKIFNLSYEPSLRNMMIFVENFIYNLRNESSPTNRMLDQSRYLNRDA